MMIILIGVGESLGETIAKQATYEKLLHETICKSEVKK